MALIARYAYNFSGRRVDRAHCIPGANTEIDKVVKSGPECSPMLRVETGVGGDLTLSPRASDKDAKRYCTGAVGE